MADDETIDGELVDIPVSLDTPADDEIIDGEVLEDAGQWPVLDAALEYLRAGWSPTPLRGKVPTQKAWVGLRPSVPDCWSWWSEGAHDGVGIVCGRISNNLLVVDIEGSLMADNIRMAAVFAAAQSAGVLPLMHTAFADRSATTPSGGRHLFLRITDSEVVPGNEKLAFSGTDDNAILLAETRGEGGQAAVPPATGRRWVGQAGPGKTLPVTAGQAKAILGSFRSVNEFQRTFIRPVPTTPYVPDADREPSVADAWVGPLLSGEIRWCDILDEGWTANGHDTSGRSLWIRPDYGHKTLTPVSAKGYETYTSGAVPVLVNHSSSVQHLPAGGGYKLTPARVWALCFFNGDESAANSALEQAAATGEVDARITRPIPTSVLDEARTICETKSTPPALRPFVVDTQSPINDADWWQERDYLSFIHTSARASLTSPAAVLATVLVRAAVEISPQCVLPKIIGDYGSLNLFAGLVGQSGGGKGASIAVGNTVHPWNFEIRQPGSGEGLLHLFVKAVRDDDGQWKLEQHTERVMLVADEVDTLTALAGRQGATLLPVMRTMWSSGEVGFAYADQTKRLHLPSHRYRLGAVVGVQPLRAGALFDDSDGGTPQRFFWAPTTDPTAPDVTPDHPTGLFPWRVPADAARSGFKKVIIDVCEQAVTHVREERIKTLRGERSTTPAHHTYMRLKVAALLGLLDGRIAVDESDWELSGRIMEASDQTREHVAAALAAERARVGHTRAEAKAIEAVTISEKVAQATSGRAARVLARAVHRAAPDGLSIGKAKAALRKADRPHMDEVVQFAVSAGWVVEQDKPHQQKPLEPVQWIVPGKQKP